MSPSGTVPVPFVTTQVRVGGIGCAETVTELDSVKQKVRFTDIHLGRSAEVIVAV
jgi:hypothetical protein